MESLLKPPTVVPPPQIRIEEPRDISLIEQTSQQITQIFTTTIDILQRTFHLIVLSIIFRQRGKGAVIDYIEKEVSRILSQAYERAGVSMDTTVLRFEPLMKAGYLDQRTLNYVITLYLALEENMDELIEAKTIDDAMRVIGECVFHLRELERVLLREVIVVTSTTALSATTLYIV